MAHTNTHTEYSMRKFHEFLLFLIRFFCYSLLTSSSLFVCLLLMYYTHTHITSQKTSFPFMPESRKKSFSIFFQFNQTQPPRNINRFFFHCTFAFVFHISQWIILLLDFFFILEISDLNSGTFSVFFSIATKTSSLLGKWRQIPELSLFKYRKNGSTTLSI